MTDNAHLFCLGLGFTTMTLGRQLLDRGWKVSGTTRNAQKAQSLKAEGFEVLLLEEGDGSSEGHKEKLLDLLYQASHIINSSPPNEKGDVFMPLFTEALSQSPPQPKWFGYLSTIGVYGEHHGAWIDEDAPLYPVTKRSKWRVRAEQQWQEYAQKTGLPLHIFRLPGIYGVGRNQMETLRKGKSRRLVKKDQVFNRIHVEDIAQVLQASMTNITPGEIFNISDDLPAPPQDVVSYAASLLDMPPPPVVLYEEAELTPMARSFYGECKRVRNQKIKDRLKVTLKYPTYKQGLLAVFQQSEFK